MEINYILKISYNPTNYWLYETIKLIFNNFNIIKVEYINFPINNNVSNYIINKIDELIPVISQSISQSISSPILYYTLGDSFNKFIKVKQNIKININVLYNYINYCEYRYEPFIECGNADKTINTSQIIISTNKIFDNNKGENIYRLCSSLNNINLNEALNKNYLIKEDDIISINKDHEYYCYITAGLLMYYKSIEDYDRIIHIMKSINIITDFYKINNYMLHTVIIPGQLIDIDNYEIKKLCIENFNKLDKINPYFSSIIISNNINYINKLISENSRLHFEYDRDLYNKLNMIYYISDKNNQKLFLDMGLYNQSIIKSDIKSDIISIVIYNKKCDYEKKMYNIHKKYNNSPNIFYVTFKENLTENLVVKDNIILVKGTESVQNIQLKTISAMEYIAKKYNPDYILRTNISTVVNYNLLCNELSKYDINKYLYLTGCIVNMMNYNIFIAGGTSIILNRNSYNLLINSLIRTDIIDDVAFGLIFYVNNIFPELVSQFTENSEFNDKISKTCCFYRNKRDDRLDDVCEIEKIYNVILNK